MKKETIFEAVYGLFIFLILLLQGFSLMANGDDPAMWSARATIAQAFFACITLFATIFMYKRQNEMTRRQINLSLYEKRYKIYNECILFIRDIYNYNKFPEYKKIKMNQETIKIFDAENVQEFYHKTFPDALFLLTDEDVKQLEEIAQKKMELLEQVNKIEYELRGILFEENEYNKKCNEIEKKIGEFDIKYEMLINESFKKYLDFKKI